MNVITKKDRGFTIIEVVLVLAIAGLIFLVVFLALPALQRSQRDTQRRSDVGRVVAAIQSYQTNKNGTVPTLALANSDLVPSYLQAGGSSFEDPLNGTYDFAAAPDNVGGTYSGANKASLGYVPGKLCDGTSASKSVAVTIMLEGGGTYCVNN